MKRNFRHKGQLLQYMKHFDKGDGAESDHEKTGEMGKDKEKASAPSSRREITSRGSV